MGWASAHSLTEPTVHPAVQYLLDLPDSVLQEGACFIIQVDYTLGGVIPVGSPSRVNTQFSHDTIQVSEMVQYLCSVCLQVYVFRLAGVNRI